eukprot:CAMPEP_0172722518 /NCGR_PEP_ID=MMETSP1074-20121228/81681_1 /TAXON_ID=2916 /ORGANISM="Ceratium fusus, Strain PA161109" /LENGTH=226 /DNA_ID=CAMNT_0013548545 /DNA_START=108 /DNA_END=788 /DNA_ORIENTATION=-
MAADEHGATQARTLLRQRSNRRAILKTRKQSPAGQYQLAGAMARLRATLRASSTADRQAAAEETVLELHHIAANATSVVPTVTRVEKAAATSTADNDEAPRKVRRCSTVAPTGVAASTAASTGVTTAVEADMETVSEATGVVTSAVEADMETVSEAVAASTGVVTTAEADMETVSEAAAASTGDAVSQKPDVPAVQGVVLHPLAEDSFSDSSFDSSSFDRSSAEAE